MLYFSIFLILSPMLSHNSKFASFEAQKDIRIPITHSYSISYKQEGWFPSLLYLAQKSLILDENDANLSIKHAKNVSISSKIG